LIISIANRIRRHNDNVQTRINNQERRRMNATGKWMVSTMAALAVSATAAETLVFDQPQVAGMSGLRAHWDRPIPVAEDGARAQVDSVVKDRGQTAVWDGETPGPLCFDAVHRHLLVRFPGAAEKIAEALAAGKAVEKVELVLPYLDEELWPTGGGADYPVPDGYRYRMNWGVAESYRERRPNWHAVAHVLRKPWAADPAIGPTYNAAINGAVYWKRFGASDTTEDRFPDQLGPAEVSSYKPDGRMDITAVLTDPAFGKTVAERLRTLADCGFVVQKWETYDARFFGGSDAYEWASGNGARAILVKRPQLVVTLKAMEGERPREPLPPPADVAKLAANHKEKPAGTPTAVIPSAAEVAKLNEQFMAKPAWMPDWQYAHVRQLMGLASGGHVQPFYYRVVPGHVVNRARQNEEHAAKAAGREADSDYAVYLAWLDWMNGQPPRWWAGHLTAADTITQWYNFRAAIPAAVQDSILLCWNAWLMPDRETEMDPVLRRQPDNVNGKLVHPMTDDPRVGLFSDGRTPEWETMRYTYYQLTGDWRGNKSFYRSGFTREMSTANFNSGAVSGALLCGQIVGSERAIADGRAGLMQFPFWMWTHNAGVGQEYVDHYYWAIATAGNKIFPDFCEQPEDKMAGWSILEKTVNDLAGAWHPNLKKLMGPASRTFYEHVLGVQDGLYHVLHVLSPQGALSDVETGRLPALAGVIDEQQKPATQRPPSAWGHDYPAATVALQSMSGPWAAPWFTEMVDEKPLPWSLMAEKKVVAEGDWVTTYFGEHYGLSSIRLTPQTIHVLGHWRRQAGLPESMTDIGTLDMRIGYNQTQFANDGEGVVSRQGVYRCYQSRNRLIMLSRPQPEVIAQQAKERKIAGAVYPAQQVTRVQCSAALFSYEQPQPTWEIFVDGAKIAALPATARYGQVITIRDGVSYLSIRPLPTDDFGRDAEVTLEAGQPQQQAYHWGIGIRPALLINAHFYNRAAAIGADTLKKLDTAQSGFIVEMGDEKEYGSFAKFQAHVRGAKLAAGEKGAVTYTTAKDTLAASWDGFTVNGIDPYAEAKARKLMQDTTLSQMGKGRLEKNGAVVEPGEPVDNPALRTRPDWQRQDDPFINREEAAYLVLQTFPKQKVYVAANLLPNYRRYSFREPGGVEISADGPLSMGRWAVKDSRQIDIVYHAFGGEYLPPEAADAPATSLLITGTQGRPQVTLNGKSIEAESADGGWKVPLAVVP